MKTHIMKNIKQAYLLVLSSPLRLAYQTGRRQLFRFAFFFGFALLAFGYAQASAYAQEAPSVSVQANAPGWVTIIWEHSGKGANHYLIQRQDPTAMWTSEANVGSHTDKGLKASTTYNYRVCAVDSAGNPTCSPWIKVTTMPPESSGSGYSIPIITRQDVAPDRISIAWTSTTRYSSFNVRWFKKSDPSRAGQVNMKGRGTAGEYVIGPLQTGLTYVILVQGCNSGILSSSCSKWGGFEATTSLPPPPPPTAPTLTASAASGRQITLTWGINEAERITRTVVERDGRLLSERAAAINRLDDTVRPNTEYTYRVCLKNQTGTACSNTVTAMAKPVAPSALANVNFTQSRFSGAPGRGVSRESALIKNLITASWRNTDTPGQFITLEREDRVPLDRIRVGPSWVEVKRLSAKNDPTEIWTDLKPAGTEIGAKRGNTFRVCAVVPALGKAGTTCSSPFTAQ
jgi:hypothetical protein